MRIVFFMGQKPRTLGNGLGFYMKQFICKRSVFGPIVELKQYFNVENRKTTQAKLIKDKINYCLFCLPRNVRKMFVLTWEYKTKLYSILQRFYSLSLFLDQISIHGGSFPIYSSNASILAIHL